MRVLVNYETLRSPSLHPKGRGKVRPIKESTTCPSEIFGGHCEPNKNNGGGEVQWPRNKSPARTQRDKAIS